MRVFVDAYPFLGVGKIQVRIILSVGSFHYTVIAVHSRLNEGIHSKETAYT